MVEMNRAEAKPLANTLHTPLFLFLILFIHPIIAL